MFIKNMHSILWIAGMGFLTIFSACSSSRSAKAPPYKMEVGRAFYDSIVQLDSIFFEAYNTCKLNVMDSLFSDDLEFYHDRGGLSTSKSQTMEAYKNNICGKVTRSLLKGSIEVYRINNFGAVEIGYHGFYNLIEKNTTLHYSKFINIWHHDNGRWKLSRVISLH